MKRYKQIILNTILYIILLSSVLIAVKARVHQSYETSATVGSFYGEEHYYLAFIVLAIVSTLLLFINNDRKSIHLFFIGLSLLIFSGYYIPICGIGIVMFAIFDMLREKKSNVINLPQDD